MSPPNRIPNYSAPSLPWVQVPALLSMGAISDADAGVAKTSTYTFSQVPLPPSSPSPQNSGWVLNFILNTGYSIIGGCGGTCVGAVLGSVFPGLGIVAGVFVGAASFAAGGDLLSQVWEGKAKNNLSVASIITSAVVAGFTAGSGAIVANVGKTVALQAGSKLVAIAKFITGTGKTGGEAILHTAGMDGVVAGVFQGVESISRDQEFHFTALVQAAVLGGAMRFIGSRIMIVGQCDSIPLRAGEKQTPLTQKLMKDILDETNESPYFMAQRVELCLEDQLSIRGSLFVLPSSKEVGCYVHMSRFTGNPGVGIVKKGRVQSFIRFERGSLGHAALISNGQKDPFFKRNVFFFTRVASREQFDAITARLDSSLGKKELGSALKDGEIAFNFVSTAWPDLREPSSWSLPKGFLSISMTPQVFERWIKRGGNNTFHLLDGFPEITTGIYGQVGHDPRRKVTVSKIL